VGTERKVSFSRNFGGGTVMFWGAFSYQITTPIENIWGLMAHKVYDDQFHSVNALKNRICQVWEDLSTNYLENLVNSMPERIYKVIKNNKNSIHY